MKNRGLIRGPKNVLRREMFNLFLKNPKFLIYNNPHITSMEWYEICAENHAPGRGVI